MRRNASPRPDTSYTRERVRAVPRAALRAFDVLFVVDVEVLSFPKVFSIHNISGSYSLGMKGVRE